MYLCSLQSSLSGKFCGKSSVDAKVGLMQLKKCKTMKITEKLISEQGFGLTLIQGPRYANL